MQAVKKCLRERRNILANKLLDELIELENPAVEDLKRLLRNKGKSSILEKDIEEIIKKYS